MLWQGFNKYFKYVWEKKMKEKDFIEILWKYFERHSQQRMEMLNFYLVAESLFVAGYIELCNTEYDFKIYRAGIGVAIIVFSITFFLFDQRTKEMIHKCEEGFLSIENKYSREIELNEILIFSREKEMTNARNTFKHWTYTSIMTIMYLFFSCIGILCILLAVI